jgi:polyribonucleotide nucleotidyltransferase
VAEKIIAALKAFAADRESRITETIDVPVVMHRNLIGRGGDIRRGLESEFNVSINIPGRDEGKTGIRIAGQPADVEKAKERISSMVKEREGVAVQVPRALHHIVSGNGQIFRRLRQNHNVTVDHGEQTPPAKPTPAKRVETNKLPLITDEEDPAADAHSWKIQDAAGNDGEEGDIAWIIRGNNTEEVEAARKAILAAVESATSKGSQATGYLTLADPRLHRHIIGQGGSTIKSIRADSGCAINVPRDGKVGDPVEIVGERGDVEKAKELVLTAVRDGAQRYSNR